MVQMQSLQKAPVGMSCASARRKVPCPQLCGSEAESCQVLRALLSIQRLLECMLSFSCSRLQWGHSAWQVLCWIQARPECCDPCTSECPEQCRGLFSELFSSPTPVPVLKMNFPTLHALYSSCMGAEWGCTEFHLRYLDFPYLYLTCSCNQTITVCFTSLSTSSTEGV